MKIVKILFGALAAVYAFFQIVQFIRIVTSGPQGAYGASTVAGGLVGVALGLAISVACFRSAFQQEESEAPRRKRRVRNRDDEEEADTPRRPRPARAEEEEDDERPRRRPRSRDAAEEDDERSRRRPRVRDED